MIGCGNSCLSEQLYKSGCQDIVNIDISPTVIQQMSERCKDMPSMKFLEMNCLEMSSFPEESFDVVIDKGTRDALRCNRRAGAFLDKMDTEIHRVLVKGGLFLEMTYTDQDPLKDERNEQWDIVIEEFVAQRKMGADKEPFFLFFARMVIVCHFSFFSFCINLFSGT